MSKHIGLLTKVDNTGSKWYRRVLNVGDTRISAGCLVEVAYDSHSTGALTLTANPNISCDYNQCRLISGDDTTYNQPTGKVLGVAIQEIPQRGATVGDVRYYDGWVQFKGAAQISTTGGTVTANTVVAVGSSGAGHGNGHGACMMTADAVMAGSGGIGYCLSTCGGDPDWTWVYLWLN